VISSSILIRFAWTATASLLVNFSSPSLSTLRSEGGLPLEQDSMTPQAAKLVCKVGFKPGKTPVSLTTGAKVSCVSTKSAAAGKKLLTGMAKTCFACHGPMGIAPASLMSSNLRAQGYTLKPADITAAFAAHLPEMGAVTMSSKDAKDISAYLQSIKIAS
jgi:mono/diheme cytochrome c family protein